MHCVSMRLVTLLAAVFVSGCALPYYLQAASGQVRLLRQRVPIAEVIADPATDAGMRAQLELVDELRRFAFDVLALPPSDSYTAFVELEGEAVVWNVVAAEEFSVEPLTWCFPVAGCVAYRGYFDAERARAFAQRLQERGLETFVGGAPAYSTLGHFDDPVLSTMLSRGDVELAAMLFHELAHQRIYVKDDTELSESFASAVEQYAVAAWLEQRGASEALDRYRGRLGRQHEFAELIAAQRERLAAIFAQDLPADRLRSDKAEAYQRLRVEYEALKRSWGGAGDYDAWFEGGFNNAKLVALTSYQRWVPGLKSRLAALGPTEFYAEFSELLELMPAEREVILSAWNDSVMPALADQ